MLLSNKAPFHGVDEDELIQNIFDAKINFDDPVWKNVSLEAKALIKKLLNVCIVTIFFFIRPINTFIPNFTFLYPIQ
jgi:hypothetical protein